MESYREWRNISDNWTLQSWNLSHVHSTSVAVKKSNSHIISNWLCEKLSSSVLLFTLETSWLSASALSSCKKLNKHFSCPKVQSKMCKIWWLWNISYGIWCSYASVSELSVVSQFSIAHLFARLRQTSAEVWIDAVHSHDNFLIYILSQQITSIFQLLTKFFRESLAKSTDATQNYYMRCDRDLRLLTFSTRSTEQEKKEYF